jgi:hypothetical protein
MASLDRAPWLIPSAALVPTAQSTRAVDPPPAVCPGMMVWSEPSKSNEPARRSRQATEIPQSGGDVL